MGDISEDDVLLHVRGFFVLGERCGFGSGSGVAKEPGVSSRRLFASQLTFFRLYSG